MPGGAFHGFVGVEAVGAFGDGPDWGIPPPGIIKGGEMDEMPGIEAGTATRPAAAAAAIAESSC